MRSASTSLPSRQARPWLLWVALAVAVGLGVAIAALCSCSANAKDDGPAAALATREEGVLTVACDLVSPPMNFVDEHTGSQRGFEYDLVCQVASRLGLRVEYLEPLSFSQVDDAVVIGRADLGASSITVADVEGVETPLVASRPYMNSGRSVIMAAGAEVGSLEDLNSSQVTVAVQQGSPNEVWTRRELPQAQVVYVPDAASGLARVANGTYTCAVYDSVTASFLLNNVFSQLQTVYEEPDVSEFVFVAAEGNEELIDRVNVALDELERDGTLASLKAKWFGDAS